MKPNSSKPVDGNGVPRVVESRTLLRVGVLSLQGDFEAHGRVLRALGVEPVYVRRQWQLVSVEGLIIPGGESTTMLKLIEDEGLFEPLLRFAERHPLLGTCAGSILMAKEVTSPGQRSLGLMEMTVERNAYGRQLDSLIGPLQPGSEFTQRTKPGELEAVFIRAPIIRRVGDPAKVLVRDGQGPVLVEQGLHLAATFHPELSGDRRVHELFLEKIRSSR